MPYLRARNPVTLLLCQLFCLTLWLPVLTFRAEPARAAVTGRAGYSYFDYSRAEWGANPLWDGRLEVRMPDSIQPFRPASPDKDTGQVYRPLIQPGQLVSLPDRPQIPTAIAVHDTATSPGDCSFEAGARQMRSIQRYHAQENFTHISWGPDNPDPRRELDNRGLPDATFGDVGYHFLIDCAGRVYEGRAGGIYKRGRHVYRHNQGLIGVALIGSQANRQPPAAQRAALVRLLARLCRDLGINPTGHWAKTLLDGTTRTLTRDGRPVLNIAGHNEYPDNDHTDPGVMDMDELRRDVVQRLASADELYFEQTGHNLAEPFRSYWETNGGLSIFGYPVSPVLTELNPDDGKYYKVQYYERARFELHPELAGTSYYILLGRLGQTAAGHARSLYPAAFERRPPLTSGASGLYFQETGQRLQAGFLEYWQAQGGLAIFGLPLSAEFVEETGPGRRFTVQYFERARFEYHPEAPPGYKILLGRLGADEYSRRISR